MQYLKDKRVWLGIVLLACFGMIAATMSSAKADTIPTRPAAAKPAPVVAEAEYSWTGFVLGVSGGVGEGAASIGGPVGINSTGQVAGIVVGYRHQFGAMVLGADVRGDRVFGDLKTLGVDYDYNVGGIVGVLPSKTALLYTRVEWIRAAGTGNHVDGVGLGIGTELRAVGSPVSFGVEWMHDWMDNKSFGSGVDVRADRVMGTVKFQFGGAVQSVFADR